MGRGIFIIFLFSIFLYAEKKFNSSMVISGGVSLGAYEAGYNWGIINLIKKINKTNRAIKVDFKSFAGASAGSINALISAIYWCQEDDSYFNSINKNLFYNTWVDIDYNDLIIQKKHPTNNTTLFKRDMLNIKANRIVSHLKKRVYKKGCKIPLGVAVTKVNPIIEEYKGIKIKTQSFAIVLEVFEKNKRLYIKNVNVDKKIYALKILGLDRNIALIKDILFASSAFPGAFEQVKLNYIYKGKKGSDYFIDGGVYNNIPLDLAIALAKDAKFYFFIDPDNIRDDSCKYAKPYCRCKSLINHKFLPKKHKDYNSGFLGTNLLPFLEANEIFRSMMLYETIKNYFIFSKEQRELILSSRYHPITGYFLWHFGAFLDRSFREYDYYVGVYDAIYKISKEFIKRGVVKNKNLMDLMVDYKNLLRLNADGEYVFNMLFNFEFCAKYPKIENKFSAIFNAFDFRAYQNRRYNFEEFTKFLSKLDIKYFQDNPFIKYAILHINNWYKKLARDFVRRVTYIENQKAKIDPNYTKTAKAVDFGAWISMSHLSSKDGFEFQPILIPPEEKDIFYYKLLPSEIAIDSVNGGFSLGYSAVYYGNFLIFDGIEFKLNYVYSKYLDDHLRLDVDPFVNLKNGFSVGAGVSLFGNVEKGKFWDRDRGFGVNAFVDYNDIFRFTYVKKVGKDRQHYFFFGIKNIPALFYWLKK